MNENAKKRPKKKICPFNPDLACKDCRLYARTARMIDRCVLDAINDVLNFMNLNASS